MGIEETIELLKHYNGPYKLTLHEGASERLIDEFETAYNITLPADFKTFYRFTDGFEIDEDIFNMISLHEMISNKKRHEPIWIAEYMIYSDMWGLDIDANNPDIYSIFVTDGSHIALTNTLGEFITRVLKAAVFEIGGLYHWQDEIKAKTNGNTNPEEMKQLFGVYYQCLKLGLISKEELIDRANWIITTEVDPDYFFFEMSQSKDLDDLLSILNSRQPGLNVLQVRAIWSVVKFNLLINKISLGKAISILHQFIDVDRLSLYEINEIKYLKYLDTGYTRRLQSNLNERTKAFFNHYSGLDWHNYKNWENVNATIIQEFPVND